MLHEKIDRIKRNLVPVHIGIEIDHVDVGIGEQGPVDVGTAMDPSGTGHPGEPAVNRIEDPLAGPASAGRAFRISSRISS